MTKKLIDIFKNTSNSVAVTTCITTVTNDTDSADPVNRSILLNSIASDESGDLGTILTKPPRSVLETST